MLSSLVISKINIKLIFLIIGPIMRFLTADSSFLTYSNLKHINLTIIQQTCTNMQLDCSDYFLVRCNFSSFFNISNFWFWLLNVEHKLAKFAWLFTSQFHTSPVQAYTNPSLSPWLKISSIQKHSLSTALQFQITSDPLATWAWI